MVKFKVGRDGDMVNVDVLDTETSQQITALSRDIADLRTELKRKVEGMNLVPTIGSTYVQAGQIGEVTMTCPLGSQPVSGGLKDQDNAVSLREVESFPDGNKWTVRVSNTAATGSTAFVAFVLCATLK